MKNNRLLGMGILLTLSLFLTSCSTVGENTAEYFSQVGRQLSILTNNGRSSSSGGTAGDDDTTPLDAPGDFVIGEDGNYSFSGVENADYYLLYMYDADSDSNTYAYLSSNIQEDGSGTYSGHLSDSITYAYGSYRIEAVAYPAVNDSAHRTSDPATAELQVTGEVAEPEISFVWDCFANGLNVVLDNADDYQYTAYPTLMEVTLTNEADSSDVVTASLEDVSGQADTCTVTGVTLENNYSISVNLSWNETYVTNSSATVDAGAVTVSANANAASDNYTYNTGLYNYMDYPLMAYNFDVASGGDLGSWKISSSGGMMWGPPGASSESNAEYVLFSATPAATESGDQYTYSFTAANDDGSALNSSNWGSLDEVTGQLHIHQDGTFLMQSDSFYLWTDQISSANQYHDASSVEGIWTDNGDGTINLAFDLSTETNLGHEDSEQ